MEDLLQETLTRALDCLGRFRWQGPESFRLWLQGIAENVVREAVKRHRRDAWLEILPEVPAVTVSPSRHLRREERWSRLKTALDGLSEDHRTVLVLARLEGLKLDEIAERMHRSPSAVKSLLFRAMGELRRSFGDTESLHLTDRSLEERGGGDVEA